MFEKKDIDKWLRNEPFRPFELVLSSGGRVPVKHREVCFIGRRRLHVAMLRGGDYDDFVDVALMHVAEIWPLSENGRKRKRDNDS